MTDPRGRLVVTSLALHPAGAERSLSLLLGPLSDLGWRITVVAPPGPFATMVSDEPVTVVEHTWESVPAISAASPSRARYRPLAVREAVWASIRNASWLSRYVARNRVDVLVSNSFHAHPFTLLAGQMRRRPVVVYLRDLIRPGWGACALSWVCRRAAGTIAISTAVRKTVLRARPELIENPVVVGPRPQRGGIETGPVVYLGRFDQGKGLETLAAAAPQIPARVELHGRPVVSPAAFAESLVASAQRAGGRMDAHPWTDHPEDVLAGAAVVVLPSDREPWGRAAAEAMAAGVPVVAASGGGITDLVEDGVSGLLFPPGDSAALASQVRRVLGDRQLATTLADGGWRRASGLSPARQAALVAEILDRALGR